MRLDVCVVPRAESLEPVLSFRIACIVRLAYVIGGVHAAQHVVGEEEFAVGGHHHDLQLVGEALGDDFVDEQRIIFEDGTFAGHALGVSRGGEADALGFGLRQKLAPLHFGLAVDELGFAGSFRVLDCRFFARFGFEFDC